MKNKHMPIVERPFLEGAVQPRKHPDLDRVSEPMDKGQKEMLLDGELEGGYLYPAAPTNPPCVASSLLHIGPGAKMFDHRVANDEIEGMVSKPREIPRIPRQQGQGSVELRLLGWYSVIRSRKVDKAYPAFRSRRLRY